MELRFPVVVRLIKCIHLLFVGDGGSSGVGSGEVGACCFCFLGFDSGGCFSGGRGEILVLRGVPGEVLFVVRLVRFVVLLLSVGMDLVCSFLLLEGGWDFPFVGLLSWLLHDVAAVDFCCVAATIADAGFVLIQGQDDDGRCAPEERCLAAKMLEVSSGILVEFFSCWLCFFSDSGGARGSAMRRRCVRGDPGSAESNSMFRRVLFVSLHFWRMCFEDMHVISPFSRVLSVRAWFS